MAIQGQTILRDVTLFWPFLAKKNDMSGKYQVDVCNLTEEHKEALRGIDLGERIRTKNDERNDFITCKSNFPPKVKNMARSEIDGEVVGNGTKANVKVQAYDAKSYEGTFAGVAAILVVDLVEYNGGNDDDLFGEEGDDAGSTDSSAVEASDVDELFEDAAD